jgi:hypothetical protein
MRIRRVHRKIVSRLDDEDLEHQHRVERCSCLLAEIVRRRPKTTESISRLVIPVISITGDLGRRPESTQQHARARPSSDILCFALSAAVCRSRSSSALTGSNEISMTASPILAWARRQGRAAVHPQQTRFRRPDRFPSIVAAISPVLYSARALLWRPRARQRLVCCGSGIDHSFHSCRKAKRPLESMLKMQLDSGE